MTLNPTLEARAKSTPVAIKDPKRGSSVTQRLAMVVLSDDTHTGQPPARRPTSLSPGRSFPVQVPPNNACRYYPSWFCPVSSLIHPNPELMTGVAALSRGHAQVHRNRH